MANPSEGYKSLLPDSRIPPVAQIGSKDLCLSSQIQTILMAHHGDFYTSYYLLKEKAIAYPVKKLEKNYQKYYESVLSQNWDSGVVNGNKFA